MSIKKKPYELSVWVEHLNKANSKKETKGVIIGAHDMSYSGKATSIVLKRQRNGTNTLTFQMPDRFFDSFTGEYVRNEFIDLLFSECKLKLFYDDQWFEFFIKKVDEKKQFKSFMKSFTCTDSFIDELSRNGYGIAFDTELYNNVEEIGTFTEIVLEDSIWTYHPEHNWGDFTEFKEEKLFRIPISQFNNRISGYKLWFELTEKQKERLNIKEIENVYTKETRDIELSDDAARTMFWDQQNLDWPLLEKENPLTARYVENIDNDGYIYVPYSCLNFCYGGAEPGPLGEEIKVPYDRAATETAQTVNDKLVIAPDSVDPRTLIQFLAIPKGAKIELDEDGVILNKDYHYFMTLRQWNELIKNNIWYFFEDTRLVKADVLGATDLMDATISHTYRYLYNADNEKILDTYKESWGNKVVYYDDYLSDVNDTSIIKGRKYSITNRTEINISKEIDQYTTVYNNSGDEYYSEDESENLFTNEEWEYGTNEGNKNDDTYRVCSKTATRQIIPQLARNLIQNGTNIQSTDGWKPMHYLEESSVKSSSAALSMRSISTATLTDIKDISGTFLYYAPPQKAAAYIWKNKNDDTNIIYSQGSTFYSLSYDENGCEVFEYLCSSEDKDEYRYLRQNYEQIKTNSGALKIYYIYPKKIGDVDHLKWTFLLKDGSINDSLSDDVVLELQDYSLLNFGIIGQEKIIEKDKIYCLGLSGYIQEADDYNIYIGKGSLITTGNYKIDEEKMIKFTPENFFGDQSIVLDSSAGIWEELEDSAFFPTFDTKKIPKSYILFRATSTIENPYFVIQSKKHMIIYSVELFEAYTKGYDSFEAAKHYRYSGRDLFGTEQPNNINNKWTLINGAIQYEVSLPFSGDNIDDLKNKIIFEDDIMLGSTYAYQQYYIQRLVATNPENINDIRCYDTFMQKEFLSSNISKDEEEWSETLPLDASRFSEDNYVIQTNFINMNRCKYYVQNSSYDACDCSYGSSGAPSHTCFYQKFGYCPFRFQTEKHNRRIRTLNVSKSNRFNIIQETSKVFEVYPQFYIPHNTVGKVKQVNGEYDKEVFFNTEKGMENKIGFRYEKNLKDISRTIDSDKIVTKLYVQDVDSKISKTGLCSIKTAEDNLSKDSYILNFSYYIEKGMLDRDEVEQDLYGIFPIEETELVDSSIVPQGFLKQLGYFNTQYDNLSNKIINLQDSSYNELEANLQVNLQGIVTAQEQLLKLKAQMEKFSSIITLSDSQSSLNYKTKFAEQQAILMQLVSDTFFTDGMAANDEVLYNKKYGTAYPTDGFDNPVSWFNCIEDYDLMKETWVEKHLYTAGILGQFNKEYAQIQSWKKERASYLKLINRISSAFYKKYEPYLKEGTWTDSNYLTDNAYYFGALDVSADGAIPKVTYNISVVALGIFDDIYDIHLSDTSWIEDIGMFGYNKKTGLPNKIKILVDEISYNLDDPSKDVITVRNYTTAFQDLFQQVTASVQSLTYNENIYKRSSNFTSLQNVEKDSLQGTLDTNELTYLNTDEANIQLDNNGTKGSDINNHANKYKLDGQGLFFSNDGGQHWSVGVGPGGINADYIKVGTLDAGKVRIADSNYIYFAWDKDGLVAYRDPQGINTDVANAGDFSEFNKYGLSIVERGQIKLRAGYSFNGIDGIATTEKEPGHDVGFYLFNNTGDIIFSTESSSAFSSQDIGKGTARLYLNGEMFVTDGLNNSSTYSYETDTYTFSNPCDVDKIVGWTYDSYAVETFTRDFSEGPYTWNSLDLGESYIYKNGETTVKTVYRGYFIKDGQQGDIIAIENYDDINTIRNLQQGEGYSISVYKDISSVATQIFYVSNVRSGEEITLNSSGIEYSNYLYNGSIQGLYYATGKYYTKREKASGDLKSLGAAGMFLNNKISLETTMDGSDNSNNRLFFAGIEDSNKINNIFTILRNGRLLIGGKVDNYDGRLRDLPDSLTISGYGIELDGESLRMDFDHIYDTVGGKSLTQFIQENIASAFESIGTHWHPFKGANGVEGESGTLDQHGVLNQPGVDSGLASQLRIIFGKFFFTEYNGTGDAGIGTPTNNWVR